MKNESGLREKLVLSFPVYPDQSRQGRESTGAAIVQIAAPVG